MESEKDEFYKVLVVATMSSGKSTFINSLLGKEILASKNEACTAKITEIINNNNIKEFKGISIYKDKQRKVHEAIDSKCIAEINENENIEKVKIEGVFYNIKNSKTKLMLIDTPGTNNSRDLSHQDITYDELDNMKNGMIIYLMNATQLGIKDDQKLISQVATIVKKSGKKIKLLVAINKIDELDDERENIKEIVCETRKYIENLELNKVDIIPISALAAKLLRRGLQSKESGFSRKEFRELEKFCDLFLENNKGILNKNFKSLCKDKSHIQNLINSTGIPKIESIISQNMNIEEHKIIRGNEKLNCGDSEVYKKVENQKIEINVIATMSAGKSTLINSLMGFELLPSKNQACTAKITKIIDSNRNSEFNAVCRDKKGKIIYPKKDIEQGDIEKYNDDKNVTYIDINGKIPNISSEKMNLVLIDIPGPNNSRDSNHGALTQSIINDKNKSVILYVMNAMQFEINDDKALLTEISDAMKRGGKQSKDRFIFVINKCDELDEDKCETVDGLLENVRLYLSNNFGIENPNLYPISAEMAKVIRMKQNKNELTRYQNNTLKLYYDFIEYKELHFEERASLSELSKQNLKAKLEVARAKNDMYEEALIHTGVPAIEEAINEYLEKIYLAFKKENILESCCKEIKRERVKSVVKLNHVYIKYNPYKKNSEIKINGKMIDSKRFEKIKNDRMQDWLEKSSSNQNWEGIILELNKCINDPYDITFEGRTIDYEDLRLSVEKYNNIKNTRIALNYRGGKNDSDIIKSIDNIVETFNNGPIEELKSPDIIETYNKVKNQKFEINVIATMSSGKSTLINSLMGFELLPSKNQACTATIARISDSDKNSQFNAICKDKNGKTIYPKKDIEQGDIEKYNDDKKVTYIDINGKIPNISSKKMNLVLIDTPGPNNSRDANHGALTQSIINDKNKSVVLYVMNATQLEINDDKALLTEISDAMKRGGKQSKDRFIFVINKCDALDEDKGETVDRLLENVRLYLLNNFGIENPNLYPISAEVAKVIRMEQNNNALTRHQNNTLKLYSDFIKYEELHFDERASLSESSKQNLKVKLEVARAKNDKYEEALIHTGIPAIEETVNEYLEKYAYPIKIENAVESFDAIIKEKKMKNTVDENLANSKNEYKAIRKQIEVMKEKLQTGKKLEETKKKVDTFQLDIEKFEEIEEKVISKLVELTEPYHTKTKIEKEEAEKSLNYFKDELQKIESEYSTELERNIRNSVIEEGQKLVDEYQNYLGNLKEELNVGGFDFGQFAIVKKISMNDVDNLIESNAYKEDVYKDITYKKEKSFWKPWTWITQYYTVSKKVGEKEFIDLYEVLSVELIEMKIQATGNIKAARDEAIEKVQKLKKYFKCEIDILDKIIQVIVNEMDEKTKNEEEIKERVKKDEKNMEWLNQIIIELDNIMEI